MTTEQNEPQSIDIIADHYDEIKQIEIEGYELGVKKARNALFWAAALIFVWEMLAMYNTLHAFDLTVFIFAAVISSIFLGLAFWTKKKPLTAVVLGLAAFILYKAFVIYVNVDAGLSFFKAIWSGIIVTFLILFYLFRALPDAKRLQQAMEDSKQ